jgi:hypothetical protein
MQGGCAERPGLEAVFEGLSSISSDGEVGKECINLEAALQRLSISGDDEDCALLPCLPVITPAVCTARYVCASVCMYVIGLYSGLAIKLAMLRHPCCQC